MTTHEIVFPEIPRVIYEKAPLYQVMCQLRFPLVLKIEGELPAAFQESVRHTFPIFERAASVPPNISLPPDMLQFLGAHVGGGYNFCTEDRKITLSLSSGSMGLATTEYKTWDEFKKCLSGTLNCFIDIYKPSYFERILLRYINLINRTKVNLDNSKWSKLISAPILGELGLPQFEDNIDHIKKVVRYRNPGKDGGFLLNHGLATTVGSSEVSYMIDFDFYQDQRTELTDADTILEQLHRWSGRAFRWCILDDLHYALCPRAAEGVSTASAVGRT